MKKIGSIFFVVLMTLFVLANNTFADEIKFTEVKYKTSAQNYMDKTKLESKLKKTDGIDDAELSLDSKIVTITYNPEKVSPDQIRAKIEEMNITAELIKNNDNNKALENSNNIKSKKN